MVQLENIKAIIFDLDDTLIDRKKAVTSYFEWLVKSYCPIPTDVHQIEILLQLDNFGHTDKWTFYEKLIELWNLKNISASDFIQIWRCEFYKHTIAREGVYEVLTYLSKRYLLGLISNGYYDIQINKLKTVNIKKYFCQIVISEAIGCQKPDPRIFSSTCSRLGVKAEHAVFVGDHFYNDILGSFNAGLIPIWFKTGHENLICNCHTICNLLELMRCL